MQKVLVISGNQPGDSNVGEIILRDMLACVPEYQFNVFYFHGYDASTKNIESRFSDNVTLRRCYFNESPFRRSPSNFIGLLKKFITTKLFFGEAVKAAENAICAYADEIKPDAIWIILNYPPIIAISQMLIQRLGIPSRVLIWDDPQYLLELYKYDRFSRKTMLASFRECIRRTNKVAVVSEEMIQEYQKQGNAEFCIIRHGVPVRAECSSFDKSNLVESKIHSRTIKIGFSGSLYVLSALHSFLKALDLLNWEIGGRSIELILLGNRFDLLSSKKANIRYMGFRKSPELEAILSECDVCYLSHPFESFLYRLSAFSFPTKLSTYLSLGKPVFAHGPKYSTLNQFIFENGCGVFCDSQEPQVIAESLQQLVVPERYLQAVKCAQTTHRKYFSEEVFKQSFRAFWDLD